MKIVLIIPPSPGRNNIIRAIDCSHEAKANYLWQPNDFMIITSLLNPGDTVTFVDGTADRLSEGQFVRKLDGMQGDLAIVALSSVAWKSDYTYFRMLRGRLSGIPLYVIGDIFLEADYQRLILQECDGIVNNPYLLDLSAMVYPSRETLPGVVKQAGTGPVPASKNKILVASGTPRHELFLNPGYRFPFAHHRRFTTITTVWGCPFSCSYCSDSRFPPVVRSFQDVLSELSYVERLGVKELFIADKVFGFSRPNILPLLAEMTTRFSFGWSCYFHPQLYDAELIEAMKKAGCHTMIIGVDSADVASLARFNRRVDADKIAQLMEHANRLNIDICADFILGLEHETEQDILRTIRFALESSIDFASFNIAAPLPGSHIRKNMAEKGQLHFGVEGFDTCGRMGILGNENITVKQLQRLRRRAVINFYMRISYMTRRIRRSKSLEHLLIQMQEMFGMIFKI